MPRDRSVAAARAISEVVYRWEVRHFPNGPELTALLNDDWEPFAVTIESLPARNVTYDVVDALDGPARLRPLGGREDVRVVHVRKRHSIYMGGSSDD